MVANRRDEYGIDDKLVCDAGASGSMEDCGLSENRCLFPIVPRVLYGIAALVCFQTTSIAEEKQTMFEAYNDGAGKVVRLANEETMPFLFLGKQVMSYNVDDPKMTHMKYHKKRYAKSIERFSSVQDCLLKSEQKSPHPDLTRFDWGRITGEEEAEVCVFRVASSYFSPADMRNWLASQEFRAKTLTDRKNVYVGGSWSVEQYAAKWGENILLKMWTKAVAHGFGVTITYTLDSEIYSVDTSFSTK